MAITTEYRVTVDVPNEVWERFGLTSEFTQKTMAASRGYLDGGIHHYHDVFIYNTFADLLEAKRCEAELEAVILYFRNKLIELSLEQQ